MKPVRQIRVGITLLVRKGAQSVWENGIFQNVFFLAQTLSASPHIAQASIVCCGDGNAEDRARFMEDSPVPWIDEQQALQQLDVLIEMSSGMPDAWVNQFRARGSKLVVYAVGNDFAIDAERLAFQLPHGRIIPQTPRDAVWTLEEYRKTCKPYYEALFRVPVQIMPHLWGPDFIERQLQPGQWNYQPGRKRWRVAIVEPNICTVKTSHVPMLVCDAAHRVNPDILERVCVFNSAQFNAHPLFHPFANSLNFVQHGLGLFAGRQSMVEILTGHADALVCHQWENAQNYVYYEALHGGYPLIHNSHLLGECGYRYHDFDCKEGAQVLLDAFRCHDAELPHYRARATSYLHALNPANPKNVQTYTEALFHVLEQPNKGFAS